MGNCFTKKLTSIENENTCDNPDRHQQQHTTPQPIKSRPEISSPQPPSPPPSSELEAPKQVDHDDDVQKEKRNNMENNVGNIHGIGDGGVGGGESVKIRLVVTRAELKQLLGLRKDSKNKNISMEHLVKIVRLRSRRTRISHRSGNWKPTLESIPEHH